MAHAPESLKMKDKTDTYTIDLIEHIVEQQYKDAFTTRDIDNIVRYPNGDPATVLNAKLIERQGLTQEDVNELKKLHLQRISLEHQMTNARSEDLKILFSQWESLQFALQSTWKFPEDINYHPSHRLPQCSCGAIMDNNERNGTPYKVSSSDCLIHGDRL
jgi:hypothetical protein